MEFKDKLQKLRKQNQLTQEQLSEKLYISRTAVSKWESGKGYPNIESLKDIANIFNVSVDELLSSEEIIDIAKEDKKTSEKKTVDFIYGLLDLFCILLIFLPLYPYKTNDFVYSVLLISQNSLTSFIKCLNVIILTLLSINGLLKITYYFLYNKKVQITFTIISLIFHTISVIIFSISGQTYLTAIIFSLLVIKILLIAKIIFINRK